MLKIKIRRKLKRNMFDIRLKRKEMSNSIGYMIYFRGTDDILPTPTNIKLMFSSKEEASLYLMCFVKAFNGTYINTNKIIEQDIEYFKTKLSEIPIKL